jgi:GH24 family phage-related lysozyme (muramidase)
VLSCKGTTHRRLDLSIFGLFGKVSPKTSGEKEVTAVPDAAVGPRTTSTIGRKILIEREGVVLKAYPDPHTGGDPWTIGVGHTGPDVYPGKIITLDEADRLLEKDLQRFEAAVNGGVVVPLTQHQFDALVSFTFNVGAGAFEKSTLLRKLNAGDYGGASAEFRKWNIPAMIVRRRAGEWVQFNTPDGDPVPAQSQFDGRFP